MDTPNQAQSQKPVATQEIAQVNQTHNPSTNNKQNAIESIPPQTPVDASNAIPAIITSPTVSTILAFAVLVRVIVDRPSNHRK
ncbi:MAG: hypothetical protein ACK5QS_10275 [Pseudanabaenaceae cyanobacterium]